MEREGKKCPSMPMWQFGNAAMRQCRKRGRALPACAMTNATMPSASRSVSRRAATHGAPSYIAALPHCQIATFK